MRKKIKFVDLGEGEECAKCDKQKCTCIERQNGTWERNSDVQEGFIEEIEEKKDYWIIWSIEHKAWWKPYHNGYTKLRDVAGYYSYEEACRIVKDANIGENDIPNEAMIKV